MIHIPTGIRHNSEAELKAFDAVCERLGGFNDQVSFEWVDGFLAALATGPRVPDFNEWLPKLCDDAFERAFADPSDAEQAQRALQLRLKVLCEQLDPAALMDNPQVLRLDPLMSEWTDADRQRVIDEEGLPTEEVAALQTGSLWGEGFLDAVLAFPELWTEPEDADEAEVFASLLDQMAGLVMPPDSPEFEAHVTQYFPQGRPTRDDLLAEACWTAQDLRMYWVDRAPKPATRRVASMPGRNDPCHCGSGKKFKKCHGLSA